LLDRHQVAVCRDDVEELVGGRKFDDRRPVRRQPEPDDRILIAAHRDVGFARKVIGRRPLDETDRTRRLLFRPLDILLARLRARPPRRETARAVRGSCVPPPPRRAPPEKVTGPPPPRREGPPPPPPPPPFPPLARPPARPPIRRERRGPRSSSYFACHKAWFS